MLVNTVFYHDPFISEEHLAKMNFADIYVHCGRLIHFLKLSSTHKVTASLYALNEQVAKCCKTGYKNEHYVRS